jgi:hypothetical protein
VGARTDAARAEVLAAREGLVDEVVRLEAAGRAAVDVPARLRREPVKVVGTAAGAAFLLGGGPGRLLRRVRRAVFGPYADVPKSMLPDEVEKTLKKLGPDGDRVRGTLEREFARYLDERAPQRRERDLAGTVSTLLSNVLRPASIRAGRRLAEELFDADRTTRSESLGAVRGRRRKHDDA